jgi:hypothetical protein
MGSTRVTTVIVNQTAQGMVMKVGNRHSFVRLTSVKASGSYWMKFDVNWTHQEFMLEGKSDSSNKLFLDSDDCCDYERIVIKETSDGGMDLVRIPRQL